jgi:uncharacterized protein involved in exopolysaccharide biosynthesis/Mrp family chromosome partitioning ATPase
MVSDSGSEHNRSSIPPAAAGPLTVIGPHALAAAGESPGVGGGTDLGLLSILRRRYRVVLGVGATTFALVMAATLLSPMEFGASSRLYLGELDGKARSSLANAEDLELALGGQSDLASEIEILRSRSLVSRAVRESGLNVRIGRLGVAPVRYWQWRLSGRDSSLLAATNEELRGVRAQLTDDSQKEGRYEVTFTSENEYELWSPEVRGLRTRIVGQLLGRGRLGEPLVLPGLELTLERGSERTPEAGARYQVVVLPVEDAVDSAIKTLEVTAPKSSGRGDPVKVVTLTFSHASPTLAAEFLEQLMRSYLSERQAWKTADASAVEAFVTEQLSSTRTLLDDIQRKLTDYRTENRAVVLDNEAKAMIAQISKYEEQRVAARLELAALVDVDRSLSTANLPLEAYMLGEAKDSVLEDLAASLSKARRDLTDLEVRYNASAPAVREQRAQVHAQLATIRSYVRARVKRAEDNLRTLDGIIQQYEDKLRTVPEAELGLAQLTRESQVYGALYSNLLMRQQQTAIVKASTVSRNRVLDPARVDYKEESPRLPLRLSSGLGGLLLGAAAVVLGRLLSNNFASESEVQSSLSPLPVLASVPKRRQRWARGRRKLADTPFDLLGGDVNFEFIEAFRALRTRLYQTALTPEGGEVLLVTSPSRGDGKTTIVRSLASILAADGKSVLVLDVDLRQERPLDARMPRETDLRAALIGHCEFADATERMLVAGGEYDYIGPDGAAPVELLAGARMTEFLAEAREQWDFVLIDAPTFPLVSDALSLAPVVDAVLTVIRLEATPARLALEHARRLAAVAHGHALVVNDPGSSAPRGEGYPVGASARPIRRWWRNWAAAEIDPATGHGPVRRLVVPIAGLALLVGAGIAASWAVSRNRAQVASDPGVASSVQMLAPAPGASSDVAANGAPAQDALAPAMPVPDGPEPSVSTPAAAAAPVPEPASSPAVAAPAKASAAAPKSSAANLPKSSGAAASPGVSRPGSSSDAPRSAASERPVLPQPAAPHSIQAAPSSSAVVTPSGATSGSKLAAPVPVAPGSAAPESAAPSPAPKRVAPSEPSSPVLPIAPNVPPANVAPPEPAAGAEPR